MAIPSPPLPWPPRRATGRSAALALLLAAPAAAQVQDVLDEDVGLSWRVQLASSVPAAEFGAGVAAGGGRVFELGRRALGDGLAAEDPTVVRGRDAETGALLWESLRLGPGGADSEPEALFATPDGSRVLAVQDETAVTPSLFVPDDDLVALVAWDGASGAELWSASEAAPAGLSGLVQDAVASPAADHVAVAVSHTAVGARRASLIVFDAVAGTHRWTANHEDPAAFDLRAADAALDAAAGRAYLSVWVQDTSFVAHARVFAFDLASGAFLWSDTYSSPSDHVSPADLAADPVSGRLFLLTAANAVDPLVAYDGATGARLWTAAPNAGGTGLLVAAPDGSRLAHAALVPSGQGSTTDLAVRFLDPASGAVLAAGILDPGPDVSPALVEGGAFTAGGLLALPLRGSTSGPAGSVLDLRAAAFDVTTAAPVWTLTGPGDFLTGSGSVGIALTGTAQGERVFTAETRSTPVQPELRVVAAAADSGALQWEAAEQASTPYARDGVFDAVLAADGARAWCSGEAPLPGDDTPWGFARAFEPGDGAVLWQTPLDGVPLAGPARLLLAPDESRLFVLSDSGARTAAALDASSGAVLWEEKESWWGFLRSRGCLSPDGSRLYRPGWEVQFDPVTFANSDAAAVLAVDAATGAELWRSSWQSSPGVEARGWHVAASPDGTRLYLAGSTDSPSGSSDDLLAQAYDAASGALLWTTTFDFGSLLGGTPGPDDGRAVAVDPLGQRVYVSGTLSSTLGGIQRFLGTVALDAANGVVLWFDPQLAPGSDGAPAGVASFLSADGTRLHVASGQHVGSGQPGLHAVQLDTAGGSRLWETYLPTVGHFTLNELAPAPGGGALAVTGLEMPGLVGGVVVDDQLTVLLDAASGVPLWTARRFGDTSGVDEACGVATGEGFVLVAGAAHTSTGGDDGFLERLDGAALTAGPHELSVAAGGSQELRLAAPPAAGELYLVLGSTAGTEPGLVLDGELLPLNLDAYTALTLDAPNSATHQATLGVLDPAGAGAAAVVLPPGLSPALAGLELHHAFVAVDTSPAVSFTSNAVGLVLAP